MISTQSQDPSSGDALSTTIPALSLYPLTGNASTSPLWSCHLSKSTFLTGAKSQPQITRHNGKKICEEKYLQIYYNET